jgi:hypothetical protein
MVPLVGADVAMSRPVVPMALRLRLAALAVLYINERKAKNKRRSNLLCQRRIIFLASKFASLY